MKRGLLLAIFLITLPVAFGQKKPKHKLHIEFWDFEKTQVREKGFYWADEFYGETNDKHGKWEYWDRQGRLEEVHNYWKGTLHGSVVSYYPNGKKKELGFFYKGYQDSTYKNGMRTESLR